MLDNSLSKHEVVGTCVLDIRAAPPLDERIGTKQASHVAGAEEDPPMFNSQDTTDVSVTVVVDPAVESSRAPASLPITHLLYGPSRPRLMFRKRLSEIWPDFGQVGQTWPAAGRATA
jgi:hypothetical protein